jgi:hypothetical protein
MRIVTLVAVGLALLATPSRAQTTLESAAEHVRHAWETHRVDEIVAGVDRVRLQFPGRATSESLEPGQASAMLRDFIGNADEVASSIKAVRGLGADRGYAELERRFRLGGTQGVRVQTLLLSYRRVGAGWGLVELRVVE